MPLPRLWFGSISNLQKLIDLTTIEVVLRGGYLEGATPDAVEMVQGGRVIRRYFALTAAMAAGVVTIPETFALVHKRLGAGELLPLLDVVSALAALHELLPVCSSEDCMTVHVAEEAPS